MKRATALEMARFAFHKLIGEIFMVGNFRA
jgi:hypothetical protein